jgi:hypothetical protein
VITAHLGIAAMARAAVREPLKPFHLLLLFGASVVPDAMDVLYWVTGVCSPYGLYSHTLPALLLQAAVIGGIAFLVTGSRVVALLFVTVVMLHMPGDLITGRKLVMPGGEMAGLRLYDQPVTDWLVEVPVVILGWWILRRSGRAPRWASSVWALVLMLLVQTQFDAYAQIQGHGVKPNACRRAGQPESRALVPRPGSRHVGGRAFVPRRAVRWDNRPSVV